MSAEKRSSGNLPSTERPPFPKEVFLIASNENPVFPGMVLPLIFTVDPFKKIFKEIVEKRYGYIGISLRKNDPKTGEEDLYQIGCLGSVIRIISINSEEIQVIINITQKIKINDFLVKDSIFLAQVEPYLDGRLLNDQETKGYVTSLLGKIKELIKLQSVFSEELKMIVSRHASQSIEQMTYLLCSLLTGPEPEELQELLEIRDFKVRILKILNYLQNEVEIFKVKEKINKQIEGNVSQQQREFFLKEQLRYIQKELGIEKDEKTQIKEDVDTKLKDLELSEEAKKVVESEQEKLALYDPRSSEYSVSKNYLDTILSLPWGKFVEENRNLKKVRKVLDRYHYGLEKVKERLLEFVAVQTLRENHKGSIICLVGPPGVGKTSLGVSVAEGMNRPFYRFSLGGVRDESEIKGHRRTYVGAIPGKIIKAIKLTQVMNPIIMLDEIDKMSSSFQGDPASALLEVLDPEQNSQFVDNYLDVAFDLSNVLFITTANQLETIPEPLLDRMELIQLSGYIFEEKKKIAEKYVIKKQLIEHGIKDNRVVFEGKAVDEMIRYYARDPGVRTMEKDIKTILRKLAFEIVSKDQDNGKKSSAKFKVGLEQVQKYLGSRRFDKDLVFESPSPGVVCGLAWTSMGGTTLYIESIVVGDQGKKLPVDKNRVENKSKVDQEPSHESAKNGGGFKLTGQLGDVMQESAGIAYSYVKSIYHCYRDDNFFAEYNIHLHVPTGATPKDGPSAGISMALALFSLALNLKVPSNLAMTGELSLTGKILPIGGVQEKLIAAKRADKKTVYLPKSNEKDVEKISNHVYRGLKLVYFDHFDEVITTTFKNIRKKSEND